MVNSSDREDRHSFGTPDDEPESVRDTLGMVVDAYQENEPAEEQDDKPQPDWRKRIERSARAGERDTAEPDEPDKLEPESVRDSIRDALSETKDEPSAKYEARQDLPAWATKYGSRLDPQTQEDIINYERELLTAQHYVAQKCNALDEIARVVEPYRGAIQRFGATPAQTVQRLFSWMAALSHPDMNYRTRSFQELARSFNVFNPQPQTYYYTNQGNMRTYEQDYREQAQQQAQQQQRQIQLRQTMEKAASAEKDFATKYPRYDKRVNVDRLIETAEKLPRVSNSFGGLDIEKAYLTLIRRQQGAQHQQRNTQQQRSGRNNRANGGRSDVDYSRKLRSDIRAALGGAR